MSSSCAAPAGPGLGPEELTALGGQVEGVMPAVVGIAPPLDQAAFLEVVDEQHQAAGRGPQLSRELLLALPGLRRDQPE